MRVIVSIVVKKDRNKVWGLVIKITMGMSWTYIFTSKMTVTPNLELSLNFSPHKYDRYCSFQIPFSLPLLMTLVYRF